MTVKHVWLVSEISRRYGDTDQPVMAVPTKMAAKQWVKSVAPHLVFSGDDGDGTFVARTPGLDWVARYSITKVPFRSGSA
ncbi:hypothetical protein [Nocardia rhizosphaerae]|uniref:Uncharacterized protein n=1 Tax=Nocardia rhizosphaerae TaxID=1691571 RepID=A0ABV8LD79_9NOCA